jgi:hypothetical protein
MTEKTGISSDVLDRATKQFLSNVLAGRLRINKFLEMQKTFDDLSKDDQDSLILKIFRQALDERSKRLESKQKAKLEALEARESERASIREHLGLPRETPSKRRPTRRVLGISKEKFKRQVDALLAERARIDRELAKHDAMNSKRSFNRRGGTANFK